MDLEKMVTQETDSTVSYYKMGSAASCLLLLPKLKLVWTHPELENGFGLPNQD